MFRPLLLLIIIALLTSPFNYAFSDNSWVAMPAPCEAPIVIQIATENVFCNGDATGSITASVSGGTAPYTYQWSNGANTPTISGLVAGLYILTVTDAAGQTQVVTASIYEPVALDFAFSVNGCDWQRQLYASVTNGSGQYAYLWSTGDTTNYIPNYGNYLPDGTYTLTVTQTNGCSQVATYNYVNPGPIQVQATVMPTSCVGLNTGSVSLTISGGTPPYFGSGLSGNSNYGGSNYYGYDLAPGNYTVNIFDAAGCSFYGGPYVVANNTGFNSVSATFGGFTSDGAQLNAQASPPGNGYQWVALVDGAEVFLTNNSIYSGVNESTLNVSLVNGADTPQLYRCIVNSSVCTVYTNYVSLAQSPTISNVTPNLLCSSSAAQIVIAGSNFNEVSGVLVNGVAVANYTVVNTTTINAVIPAQQGPSVITVVTANGSVDSDVIQVFSASIAEVTGSNGINSASFQITTNASSPSYVWQTNLGLGYQVISNAGQYSGANTSMLTISNISSSNDNQLVRCVVSQGGCSITTSERVIEFNGGNPSSDPIVDVLPGLSYQAALRGPAGELMPNQELALKFIIRADSTNGTVEYSEIAQAFTNAQGLFIKVLGEGSPIVGTFDAINWASGDKYLHVEVDLGTGFTEIGSQKMLSVPYSKLSEKALSIESSSLQSFETNAAALAGGLHPGQVYRNANGDLKVVF